MRLTANLVISRLKIKFQVVSSICLKHQTLSDKHLNPFQRVRKLTRPTENWIPSIEKYPEENKKGTEAGIDAYDNAGHNGISSITTDNKNGGGGVGGSPIPVNKGSDIGVNNYGYTENETTEKQDKNQFSNGSTMSTQL